MQTKTEEVVNKQATPNIYTKLHAILSEVGTLKKDGFNDMQKYEYLSETQVKAAIQPLLIEHRVFFKVDVLETLDKDAYTTKSGGTMYLTKAKVKYSFIDIDNPSDKVTGKFIGYGTDTGDKGIYKAITGAIKYILTSDFLIPTGEDPENEKQSSKPANSYKSNTSFKKPVTPENADQVAGELSRNNAKVSSKQLGLIHVLITQTGASKDDIHKAYKVESLADLGMMEAIDLIDKLKRKQEKQIQEQNEGGQQ